MYVVAAYRMDSLLNIVMFGIWCQSEVGLGFYLSILVMVTRRIIQEVINMNWTNFWPVCACCLVWF